MRVLSSVELDAVAGAGLWDWIVDLFKGGEGAVVAPCQTYSNTNNGVTTTQTCGGPGIVVNTVTGPGYMTQTTISPGTTSGGEVGIRAVGGEYYYTAAPKVTTLSCINGACTTTVSQ